MEPGEKLRQALDAQRKIESLRPILDALREQVEPDEVELDTLAQELAERLDRADEKVNRLIEKLDPESDWK
jgi:two-component sensor histidine kinase